MTELYERELSEAFASMMDDVHPDLDAILRGAEWEGARLRRRRRTTTGLAALATAACVGVGGVAASTWLPGGDAGDKNVQGAPATEPAVELPFTFAEPAGWTCEDPGEETFSCTRGSDTVTVTWKTATAEELNADGTLNTPAIPPGATGIVWTSPEASLVVAATLAQGTGLEVRDEFRGSVSWPGTSGSAAPHHVQPPEGQDLAFNVAVPEGWTCGTPGDEKIPCDSESGALLSIIQRPAADHEVWATSPDKGGPGTGVRVSEVHGEYFVSIQPSAGSPAEIDEIAAALTWDDGTPVF